MQQSSIRKTLQERNSFLFEVWLYVYVISNQNLMRWLIWSFKTVMQQDGILINLIL